MPEPGRDVAGAHGRHQHIASHARRKGVGDGAFEAVADLDPELVLLLHDEQQKPAIFPLLAELPGLDHADREGLEGVPVQRW
ncbi:MAG: hypothetical protein ABJA33_01625, partial [Pedococcus sp.]